MTERAKQRLQALARWKAAARDFERRAREADFAASWHVTGPAPDDDDGGTTCPWCERVMLHPDLGLCRDCERLSHQLGDEATRRRMAAKAAWRARKGQIAPFAYYGGRAGMVPAPSPSSEV